MSMRRQLFLVLSVMFFILLVVTLVASLSGTRRYLEQQLASHAQDAASALSITLAQSLSKDDKLLAESQVLSVFDRGYFKRIDVLGVDRTLFVSKELPEKIEGVPEWFSGLLPIKAIQGEAHISSGWRQLGKVLVVSQPTFAYQHLWRSAIELWLWISGIYVAALFLMQALLRFILHPLGLIEQSARAVQQKRFEQITSMPKAPELARVVSAMNDMSRRVGEMLDEETARAEGLRRQAYDDELTGLANHNGFELLLKDLLEGDYRFELGAIILLDIEGMKTTLRKHGFKDVSAIMKTVASHAEALFKGETISLLARRNEFTFSFILTNLPQERIVALVQTFRNRLDETINQGVAAGDVSFAIGVSYFHQDDKRSDLFARADLALETARHEGNNGLHVLPYNRDEVSTLGSFGWRTLIKNALKENRWLLVAQPVVNLDDRLPLHGELMARLVDTTGQMVPASQFLPMAARHELMNDVDHGLVTLAIERLRSPGTVGQIAINLSPQSISNSEFLTWLATKLGALKSDAERISIELSEYGCLRNIEAAQRVMELARQHGATFGIDHFGLDPQALKLLRQMPPDYVKLNGGLVGALTSDPNARALVESIVQLAHSLEILVIAQNVESDAQVAALQKVMVDGGQGYLFGAPA